MPELAEVEYYRKQWSPGLGRRVLAVLIHPRARVYRGRSAGRLRRRLVGARLLSSEAAGKQMLFRFSGGIWLGLHLGMSGALRAEAPDYGPRRHDHLVLVLHSRRLVFSDPRMFGRIRVAFGSRPPVWWRRQPPAILSAAFTAKGVAAFFRRRSRAPIKSVLLMQERFPGLGNWMADEILWRAAIHPRRPAGTLAAGEVNAVWCECRRVCRLALDTIAGHGDDVPPGLNVRIPDSWLFNHRWEDGGRCPRTGVRLARETIGGRTTCWSAARQRWRPTAVARRRYGAAPAV